MHQGPVAVWVLHARAAEADGEGTDRYSSLSFHLGVWLWRETQIVITYLHWSFCEFMLTYSLRRQEACCYDSIYQEAWARSTAAYTSQIEEFNGWEWVPWVGKKKQQELVCCVSLSVQGVAHCCYFGVHGPRIHWHNFGRYMSNKKEERAELGRWVESRKEARWRKYLCSGLRSDTVAGCCLGQTLPISYRNIYYWVQKSQPRNLL